MIFRRKRTIRKVEQFYWEGFFARLGGGLGPEPPLSFNNTWLDGVRKIAYPAGWQRAEQAITTDSHARFGTGLDKAIPPAVLAEALCVPERP